jgi:hypothetical protein
MINDCTVVPVTLPHSLKDGTYISMGLLDLVIKPSVYDNRLRHFLCTNMSLPRPQH